MPLIKQLVPIQFGGGINTKVDPKQLQAGQLLDLQNGQFSKQGQINKRFGYDLLNNTIEGGGSISTGVELALYNNELVLFDGNNIYSYLTATGNWSNRGTAISINTLDKDIIRQSSSQQLNPDMAYLNGIEVYAWEDSRGGVRYSVLDTNTKAFATSDQSVLSTGTQPKTIAFQNQIFIFYTDAASRLFYRTVNPFNPTTISAPVSVVVDGYQGLNAFPYDVKVIGNKMFVAYLSSITATGEIDVFYYDSSFVKSSTFNVNNTAGIAINAGFHGAINVSTDSSSNVWITWANGVDIRTAAVSFTLSGAVLSTTLIDTANVSSITAIESNTHLTMLICYEVVNATSYNEQTRYTTLSSAGVSGANITIRSVGIASKAYKFNNNIYLNTAYQSKLQSTDFIFLVSNATTVLSTPVIVGKCTPSTGGGLSTNGMAAETTTISTGVFKFANLQAGKILSEANTLFTLFGVNSTQLTFLPSNNFINTTQANTLLIVGGILQGYDGVSTTELGFHIFPEDVSYSPGIFGATGNLSTGTYQYITQWEWTDNSGQIYRSAPSIPVSCDVIAGQGVVIVGPSLRLTSKPTNISIVISRTSANGSTFNRITSTLAPLYNDTTIDKWIFVDSLSDSDALANELNYTTGNVLANIAPPANSIITTYNNRVFLAGLSDKLNMWYSQTVVDNSNKNTIPPQFCEELNMAIDPRGGNITALGVLNQSLIIFKSNNIFSIQGNGPDATGNNNDYGDPTLITSDVGCINANSVVICPLGLMFQSNKGIYLLDQGSNVTYIGAPVEAYNSYNITSSALHTEFNQVIFTTSQGVALVYDYYFKQWATWTNHYAQDCVVYNNKVAFITSAGKVYLQNQTLFTDAGSPVLLSFTLPNLAFAGLQGFNRVFRCFILGTYKGPHLLNVNVAYDYSDAFTQSTTITPTTNLSTWGSDTNWGSGQFWGGQYKIYQFRVDFAIQKCTAIRIQVTDNQNSSYNEGYAISSIVFEVGVLPGGNRLPTSNTYGTK